MGWAALLVFALNGAANALAFSPALTRSLALVRPEDAPDASGVTAMMTQLGMLVGIATFGTLYLSQAESSLSSADGLGATLIALSVAAVAAGVLFRPKAR